MSEGITFAEIMSSCNVHANLMGSKVNTWKQRLLISNNRDIQQYVMKMENLERSSEAH